MAPAIAAVAALAGAAVTLVVLARPPAPLLRPPHLKANFRGIQIPATLGILLLMPVVTGAVIASFLGGGAGLVAAAAGVLMGGLGLADDVWGTRHARGFAGHLRALARGTVTTGLVKAAGGGVVGIASAWAVGHRGWWVLVAGAVVALAANLSNLLDLRPGRAAKAWLVAWVLLLLAQPPPGALAVSSALAGGVAAWLPRDLRERAMLGDAGANLLGTVAGVVAIASLGTTGLLSTLGVLLVLTAVSEIVSFTNVIDSVAPLRALDRLGRLPPTEPHDAQ